MPKIAKASAVIKKKGSNEPSILHPNSRKTAKIAKNNIRVNARGKTKLLSQMKLNLLGEKVLWFKEHLLSDILKYTPGQIIDVVELYLKRFDEEADQIEMKHSVGQRKGRQHASRQDIIHLTVTQEEQEFHTCGIEIPDLMNTAQLAMLRKWGGELRYLQNFKLRRFNKPALLKETNRTQAVADKPTTSKSTANTKMDTS